MKTRPRSSVTFLGERLRITSVVRVSTRQAARAVVESHRSVIAWEVVSLQAQWFADTLRFAAGIARRAPMA